ncbi:MAG: methionine synthase [Deltaproteobacteria bacterium]|nr:methionine synthase [Deltaproteobacteria bacterium]
MNVDLPPFPATGVGSLPHTDPAKAVRLVLSCFHDVPCWPQLPRRAFLESMYVQYAAGLPGASIEGERLYVEGGEEAQGDTEIFYERFLSGDAASFAIPAERAAGLYALLSSAEGAYPAVKGQVTGPVSFGLTVSDRKKKPIFYDPVVRDVLVKHLLRVAQWQVSVLSRLSRTVILVLDEPYLASVGSAIVSLDREEVIGCLNEIFDGLPGVLCGVHCCANTDWGLVLSSRAGYLSFDAYGYVDSLLLYPEEVGAFLHRGGKLAFGIVPTSAEGILRETPETLAARMDSILGKFESRGIARDAVIRSAFLTPACGLGTLQEEEAEGAARLARDLSRLLRHRYGGVGK